MRLQLSAGRGPIEVRQCVAVLATALTAVLPAVGWTIRGLSDRTDVADTDSPPASMVFHLAPSSSALALDGLIGTHAFVIPTRGRRQRKRWFVGVSLLEEAPDPTEVRPGDVNIRADRAGGPGGQHVNTTSTAIRATHVPTGLSVRVAQHRSQARNKSAAMTLLGQLLAQRQAAQARHTKRRNWTRHSRLERGRAVAEWRGGVRAQDLMEHCFTLP